MFDLNTAIDEWCRTVVARNPGAADSLDELKDHVYCIVECLQQRGMDSQSAFRQATLRLGDPQDLLHEYAKNNSWKTTLCQLLQRLEDIETTQLGKPPMKQQWKLAIIVNSIAWAAAMISTAIVLTGTEQAGRVLMLLIAAWFISFIGLQRAQGETLKSAACDEWRWIRGKLARLGADKTG